MTRTSSERLADIRDAAERVSRAVEALDRAEADGTEDEALAFGASAAVALRRRTLAWCPVMSGGRRPLAGAPG